MRLVGRIPVEPLDDDRLTRIERRIVAGVADAAARPAPAGRPAWASAMFGAAAVAVVALIAGAVGWRLRGGAGQAPVVAEPAAFEVDAGGERSTIDIGDATLTGDRAARFVVSRPGGGVLIAMVRGKLELAVGKRGPRPPLVVRAGDTDVVVVGTRFSVDYGDGTGGVDVRVTEGAVKVVRQQRETQVAAGHGWTTGRGAVALAELDAGAGVIAAAGARGDVAIEVGPGPEVLHDRVAAVPDARVPAAGSGHAGAAVARAVRPAGERGQRPPTLDRADDPDLDLKTAIRRQPVAPPLAVGVLDAGAALVRYRDIVTSTVGDDASHAMYSIAHVQHMKLGRNLDALSTLDSYVRRFSGGKEYAAALWLRVRVSCLIGIDDRCRRAAYTYLHEARSGAAAQLAERLTLSR